MHECVRACVLVCVCVLVERAGLPASTTLKDSHLLVMYRQFTRNFTCILFVNLLVPAQGLLHPASERQSAGWLVVQWRSPAVGHLGRGFACHSCVFALVLQPVYVPCCVLHHTCSGRTSTTLTDPPPSDPQAPKGVRLLCCRTTLQYKIAAIHNTEPGDVCLEVGCHEGGWAYGCVLLFCFSLCVTRSWYDQQLRAGGCMFGSGMA